jgi:phospholipid/cholesterol/gamma-HCH transport system permease protein
VGRIRAVFEDFGAQVLFAGEALAWAVRPPFRLELLMTQAAAIGVGSTFIVAVTGLFAGMVLALQGNYAMRQFGAEGYVGGFVAISLVRELGPVFTALMVTGRSGSAITTELGTMRVSEQIDAMESMAVNPIHYLVVPRVVASTIMMPLLAVVFSAMGYLGGYLIGTYVSFIPPGPFLDRHLPGLHGQRRIPGRWRGHHPGGGVELGRHPGRRLPLDLHLHRLTPCP